jgi:undecaprenyl-diphosphatase
VIVLEAIALGIIQGLTEFMPISSSAHLVIVPWLFKWTNPVLTGLSFDVALHLGTLIAVLSFFARDWVRIIKAGVASIADRRIGADVDRRLAWFLLIGCIPGGIAGVLAEKKIDELFHQPNVPVAGAAIIAMAVIIAVWAFALLAAERLASHTRGLETLTLRDTITVGLAQALAIFPGVSRSGSTITAGLAIGLRRETAARFSFLLSAPIIAGAGLKSLWSLHASLARGATSGSDLVLVSLGFAASAVSGYLCIKYLLRFLQRNSTSIFVYYRWALAGVLIVAALLRG